VTFGEIPEELPPSALISRSLCKHTSGAVLILDRVRLASGAKTTLTARASDSRGETIHEARMDEDKKTDLGLRYATDWYTYHAGQRMVALRFFLTLIGVLLLAYGQTSNTRPFWAVGIAFFGAFISIVFYVLDVRNAELVNCGRAALDHLEQQLGLWIRFDDGRGRGGRRYFRCENRPAAQPTSMSGW
jgi:hypothetical protein